MNQGGTAHIQPVDGGTEKNPTFFNGTVCGLGWAYRTLLTCFPLRRNSLFSSCTPPDPFYQRVGYTFGYRFFDGGRLSSRLPFWQCQRLSGGGAKGLHAVSRRA